MQPPFKRECHQAAFGHKEATQVGGHNRLREEARPPFERGGHNRRREEGFMLSNCAILYIVIQIHCQYTSYLSTLVVCRPREGFCLSI